MRAGVLLYYVGSVTDFQNCLKNIDQPFYFVCDGDWSLLKSVTHWILYRCLEVLIPNICKFYHHTIVPQAAASDGYRGIKFFSINTLK